MNWYGVPTALALLGITPEPCLAQTGMPTGPGVTAAPETAPDRRIPLKLSPEALDGLRSDMREMLATLANVLDLLAAGNRIEAAKTLEEGIGMSAMSTHAGMMRASRELPDDARMLGMQMHQSASALARDLASAKPGDTLAGLQRIVAACSACHLTYRAR